MPRARFALLASPLAVVAFVLSPQQRDDFPQPRPDLLAEMEDEFRNSKSVLTVVDGKLAYAAAEFKHLEPPPLPMSSDWLPVKHHGGYDSARVQGVRSAVVCSDPAVSRRGAHRAWRAAGHWGPFGCDCFAL